jgi:hypothetical protein
VDCTFLGAFHVSLEANPDTATSGAARLAMESAPHQASSSWIAPSWVHSTCARTTSTATRCSALEGTAPGFLFVDCTSWVHSRVGKHPTGAAHSRKCTAPDSIYRSVDMIPRITTKEENPEAGRKRESPKKDEGRRRLFTHQRRESSQ